MTGYTIPDNLPYPDDYQQPADSPAAIKALADNSQAALIRRVEKTGGTMTGPLTVPVVTVNDIFLRPASAGPEFDGSIWNIEDGPIQTRAAAGHLVPLKTAPGTAPDEAVTVAQLDTGLGQVNGALAGKADVGHTHPNMAQMVPGTTYVGDGQITAHVFTCPDLGPGQEAVLGPFGIVSPGTLCVLGTQHPSTWIYAVYDDRGDGTAVIRVRNGTTATTHTNIKVHALFINPPPSASE